jgi:hypothetical protein
VMLSLSNLGLRFFMLVVPFGINGLAGLLSVEDGAILIGILLPGEGI